MVSMRVRLMTLILSFGLLVIGVTGVVGKSTRVEFTVNTTNDTTDALPGNGICADSNGDCSLRAAITEANATDVADVITLPAGTYTLTIAGTNDDVNLTGDLDIRSSLTLQGAGAATTIIDGNALEGGFDIQPSALAITVTISGVTITGNDANSQTGVIVDGNSTVTFNNIVVDGNSRGMYFYAGTNVTLTGSEVKNSTKPAQFDGAGIHNSGTLQISNSVFTGNHTFPGGGHGGAIMNRGALTVTGSTFSNNGAYFTGGAISTSASQQNVTIADSVFTENYLELSAGQGGAVFVSLESKSVQILNSTFTGNTALYGGGIGNVGPSTTIYNSTISGNTAQRGGGIYIPETFYQNSLTIINSTISGNTATSGANRAGGGIYVGNGGHITLNNVTTSANNAPEGGGLYVATGGFATDATVNNTIIAGNFASLGADCSDPGSKVVSTGYNVIGNTNNCPKFTASGDQTNVSAGLAPLANNGGLTQTHALQAGSVAINAGNAATCIGYDQRYYPRVNTCDVGAYEFSAPTTTVTPTTSAPTPTPTVDPGNGSQLLVNGGFETKDINNKPVLSPWTLKNGSGDKIKCNTPEKEVAYSGECAFRFKGVTGESAKLAQNPTVPAGTGTGDSIHFSLFSKASGAVNAKIKVLVVYSTGAEKGKITLSLTSSGSYIPVSDSTDLTNDPISKIKLQITNKGTSGKIYLDEISLLYLPAGAFNLIPLP